MIDLTREVTLDELHHPAGRDPSPPKRDGRAVVQLGQLKRWIRFSRRGLGWC
jgi:hypothetical protein